MNIRALAASTKPLHQVFLDHARGGTGFSRLRRSPPILEEDDERVYTIDQGGAALHMAKPSATCAPDVAAVAILLGRAFEGARHALARMLDPDAVIIIQVPQPDLVKPVQRFLRQLLASEAQLIDGNDLNDRNHVTKTSVVSSRSRRNSGLFRGE